MVKKQKDKMIDEKKNKAFEEAATAEAPKKMKSAEKQQNFVKEEQDKMDFYVDPYGQMTINRIDTPLGKLAQRIIQAKIDIRRLEEQMVEDEDVLMKEMKNMKPKAVSKIKVLGHQLVYQEARTTAAKLIIKDLE